MPSYERLGYGSDDGSQWGDTLDRLGMYGVTPVARYTSTLLVCSFNVSTSSFGPNSTFGWLTPVDMSTLVAQVSSVVTALKNIGMLP